MKALESKLRAVRAVPRKALVPYFVAGLTHDWIRHVEAAAHAGADAIEIGVPFSDPMIDGVVIQEAVFRSLANGTTLDTVCHDLASLSSDVPLVVMTYYNIFLHYGLERAAGVLAANNVLGAIVPDLPLEESSAWMTACERFEIANVFLVAPSSPSTRVASIAHATQGFCYASARMAVTGRAEDEGDAQRVVRDIRAVADVPVYVGIGISTPEQAQRTSSFSDGVIVGSALVQRILDGADAHDVEDFVSSFRRALDSGATSG